MNFFQRIYNNVLNSPGKVILSDGDGEYSYRQMWDISSRVYAYLTDRRIGREDVVMLLLPREAQAVMAVVGVWRAGAAVMIHEDWIEEESIASSKRDAACRVVIDAKAMGEIRGQDPLEGWKDADEHDLAYITYTTGTTGEIKGVMHEFGSLGYIVDSSGISYEGWSAPEEYRTALMTSLHSAISSIIQTVVFGTYMDIVPREVVSDCEAFRDRLLQKRIMYTFMSPVMLERIGTLDSPYLECIGTSFEPATNMCPWSVPTVNEYGMTECPFVVSEFVIDRQYVIVPIGKPIHPEDTFILDRNGSPVADGEIGEICFVNHFCRGYLNMPEATAAQFRGGLFHTRDLAKVLPDGNWVMLGRVNDSLQTPSGLVVALEIEALSREVMAYRNIYVKVFEGSTAGRLEPVICAYSDMQLDLCLLRERLSRHLPEYKLPTDFVKVDSFKYKNGKAIRLELKNPYEKV